MKALAAQSLAGFKELGPQGALLEQQVMREAQRSNMRIIGPNCLGVMSPVSGLNATFAAGMAQKGSVAFLSQSGALCTAVLDWSLQESVGFSAFVSTGSMLDVGWGDLISYFGDDSSTKSILIYMESIGDVRSFLSAAREVALSKPIIMIKAGRTADAARAAASHTGAMTGSDDVLDAALRRAGVLRVERISDLFYMAEILAKQPRPQGRRLSILTNAGGPGVLATDALVTGGGELAQVSESTKAKLNEFLPPHWSRANPIDILGDAGADRYAKALNAAMEDPNSDGLLVVLTPQDMTDPTATAGLLRQSAHAADKPILASWMGGGAVQEGKAILNKAGIPTFDFPDSAARAFNYMWRYSANLKSLYETPELSADDSADGRAKAAAIIAATRAQGRIILTETESKLILAAYGIPVVPTEVGTTAAEAVRLADTISYPVVLKLFSHTITHKTDVGGVQLNLTDRAAVERAFAAIKDSVTEKAGADQFQGVTVQPMIRTDGYELILGSSIDPQFGPVLLFGMGGQLVEVFKDRALALPPLNMILARRLIEQTHIYKALKGVRGRAAVDLAALEQILVRFSQLVVEQSWIKEIDINPLIASASGLISLDARVVLHPANTKEPELPLPAIRGYPSQYITRWTLRDGTPVTIRPIRPEDEPLMARFHGTLSEETVRFRYFHTIKLSARITHERLTRVCFGDYDRQIALVAERADPATKQREIIGVGRLTKITNTEAEFALLVSDACQGKGLGTKLLQHLVEVARHERLERVSADMLLNNMHMQRLCGRLGFQMSRSRDEDVMHAWLAFGSDSPR
jgi:acetyltransferase